MISTLFNTFMEIYDHKNKPKVDSNEESHILICSQIPKALKSISTYKKYYIKGSEGNGVKTFYPWICLMDETITRSPQKGLYIAILFRKDMSGFYITLNQGITFFKQTFRKSAYSRADEAASYFRNKIKESGFIDKIDLGSVKNDNGYGFEKTTVIGKFFEKYNFADKDIYDSLNTLSNIYDEIIDTIDGKNYESIIPKLVGDDGLIFTDAESAIEEIDEVIYRGKKPAKHNLREVVPKIDQPRLFREISSPSNKKIDYVKRAQDNAETGLLGEKLILAYEIERLNFLGLEKYAEKVKQVSLENDVLGYDILSYDINDDGVPHEIYIEIKTSSSKKDTDFFVSRNEVLKSREFKNRYWLYRVYDCSVSGGDPKFYRVNGLIEDNFELQPETYKASLKIGANIINSNFQQSNTLNNLINNFGK